MTPQEIAGIEPGDELTFKVEKPVNRGGDDLTVRLIGGVTYYFSPNTLAHATLTKAPPRPLEVGDVVEFGGERWVVKAPPLPGVLGLEVALWREGYGYRSADASDCTRVQP